MTMISYFEKHHVTPSSAAAGGISPKLVSALTERAIAAWNRRKTERMLEGLPQEIRKDIGWPTTAGK